MARGDYDEELGRGCLVILGMVFALVAALFVWLGQITNV